MAEGRLSIGDVVSVDGELFEVVPGPVDGWDVRPVPVSVDDQETGEGDE